MTIVIVPPYPQRNSPTFAADADSWNSQLPTWTDQVNATAVTIAENAATATTQAGIATTQAGLATTNGAAQVALAANQVALATTQANNAANSAASAASTAGVTKWVSGTTYTEGNNVWSPIDFKTYRRKITGAGTTDPSVDSTNWQILIVSSEMVLLSSATASNSTAIDFTGLDETYFKYIVEYYNLNGSESTTLLCQVQVDGSWQTSGYQGIYQRSTTSSVTATADNTSIITYASGLVTTSSLLEGQLIIGQINNTTKQKTIEATLRHTSMILYKKQYYYNSTSAVTGLRFVCSSGNIASGTFKLYGLKA